MWLRWKRPGLHWERRRRWVSSRGRDCEFEGLFGVVACPCQVQARGPQKDERLRGHWLDRGAGGGDGHREDGGAPGYVLLQGELAQDPFWRPNAGRSRPLLSRRSDPRSQRSRCGCAKGSLNEVLPASQAVQS